MAEVELFQGNKDQTKEDPVPKYDHEESTTQGGEGSRPLSVTRLFGEVRSQVGPSPTSECRRLVSV